jgi:hypothetical protein
MMLVFITDGAFFLQINKKNNRKKSRLQNINKSVVF